MADVAKTFYTDEGFPTATKWHMGQIIGFVELVSLKVSKKKTNNKKTKMSTKVALMKKSETLFTNTF